MSDRPLWQLLLQLKSAMVEERPLTCTECFSILEYLADLLGQNLPADRQAHLLKAAKRHLAVCPDCQTHYQARLDELERLLQAKAGAAD